MVPTVTVNYLAVLACGIASMVIGMLWYSPSGLFGKAWMRLMGYDKLKPKELEAMKKKGCKSMAFAFVSSLVMAYVLAHVLSFAQAETWLDGVQGAFWVWLGFIATVMLGSVLWENKPMKLYWINSLHYLVTLMVYGVILTVWI